MFEAAEYVFTCPQCGNKEIHVVQSEDTKFACERCFDNVDSVPVIMERGEKSDDRGLLLG